MESKKITLNQKQLDVLSDVLRVVAGCMGEYDGQFEDRDFMLTLSTDQMKVFASCLKKFNLNPDDFDWNQDIK